MNSIVIVLPPEAICSGVLLLISLALNYKYSWEIDWRNELGADYAKNKELYISEGIITVNELNAKLSEYSQYINKYSNWCRMLNTFSWSAGYYAILQVLYNSRIVNTYSER